MSIRLKMLIPMVVIAVVAAAATLISAVLIFSDFVTDTASAEVNVFSDVIQSEIDDLHIKAQMNSQMLSLDSNIRHALAEGDRETLLSVYGAYDRADGDDGVDFCTFLDTEGNVVLRAHEPEKHGDSLASQDNVAAALRGQTLTTAETGSSVKLSVRSGVPIYGDDGELVGAVSTGYRLDTEEFVDRMKALVGAEVTIFLGDERLSTTVINTDGSRAIGTKAAESVSRQVLAGASYAGTAKVVGKDAFVKYVPLRESSGTVLGMMFVGQYTDTINDAIAGFIFSGVLVAVIVVIAAFVTAYLISSRILGPIKAAVSAAEKLAVGDTDVSIEATTKDEMRDLIRSFNSMIEHTREQAETIETIAGGDFSVQVAARSESDSVSHALRKLVELMGATFAEITGTAGLVADGAHQISGGSNALAQGSTEQAAAVEELSSSIADVAGKARTNATLATKAATLGEEIKRSAETGSEQMGRMTEAVVEITEASRSISQVIGVIDDIAFQTNILALNAAIEAARAGQHGKGFAVVAEEVRALAAKSQAAAKDTGALIENSMQKAELGAKIAAETASSLTAIVTGINETTEMIGSIAAASDEQSTALGAIDTGIDQVSLVVQQNNATAEESAAASVQLSGQSEKLRELVSQFRLAAGSAVPLPPASAGTPSIELPEPRGDGGYSKY